MTTDRTAAPVALSPVGAVLERLLASRDGSTGPDDDSARGLQGALSMWVFVLGDMVIFGVYFVIYAVARSRAPETYLAAQQHLDQTIGVVNTVVLLTSSWFVARAVWAARAADRAGASRNMMLAAGCGVLFLAVKAVEWQAKITAGHTLASDDFFAFYFMLTGVHVLHVLMGLIIVGVVLLHLRSPARLEVRTVESGAVYWHMVDLLWLIIFALLYLMR